MSKSSDRKKNGLERKMTEKVETLHEPDHQAEKKEKQIKSIPKESNR